MENSIQRIFKDIIYVYHYATCLDNINVISDKVPDHTGNYIFRKKNSKDLNAAKTSFRVTVQPEFQV